MTERGKCVCVCVCVIGQLPMSHTSNSGKKTLKHIHHCPNSLVMFLDMHKFRETGNGVAPFNSRQIALLHVVPPLMFPIFPVFIAGKVQGQRQATFLTTGWVQGICRLRTEHS